MKGGTFKGVLLVTSVIVFLILSISSFAHPQEENTIFSVSPGEFTVCDVSPLGEPWPVPENIFVWNGDNVSRTVFITAEVPPENMVSPGYEPIPNENWVVPYPSSVEIRENSFQEVQILLNIPCLENLTGQKWEVWIPVERQPLPGEVSVLRPTVRMKIETTELPPSVMLNVEAEWSNGDITLTIEHVGGDDLEFSDLVVKAGDDNTSMVEAPLAGSGTFSVGEVTTATWSDASTADNVITVYVIHDPSDQRMFSSTTVETTEGLPQEEGVFTVSPAEFTEQDVSPTGEPYTISQTIKVWNSDNVPRAAYVTTEVPPENMVRLGYEPIPNEDWVMPYPSSFEIEENSFELVHISMNIPRWENLTGQKWEVWIPVKRQPLPGEIGALRPTVRMKIETSEELPQEEENAIFSVSPGSFTVCDVPPLGEPWPVPENIIVWNGDNVSRTVFITAEIPPENMISPGYEPIPNENWVRPYPTSIRIEENSCALVQLSLNIPRWENLAGKKWEVWIPVERQPLPGEVGVLRPIVRMKIETAENFAPLTVESEYSGFFLHNVNAITNTYRAIPSSGTDVSSVLFQMDNETQTDSNPPYEATFNMGSVGLNPTLNVTAYLADNRTVSVSLSPTMLETPVLLSQMINTFYTLGQVTVSKKANGCWKMDVNGEVSMAAPAMYIESSPLPFNVGAGEYELPFSDWVLSFTIESDDYDKQIDFESTGLSINNAKFMDKEGLSFDAELSSGFTVRPNGTNEITDPTIMVSISGDHSWTYTVPISIGPIPIRVYVSPHVGAGVNVGFGPDNPIAVNSVDGYVWGRIELKGGVSIPGFGVGVYFDGTVSAYLVAIPYFDFDKVCVEAEAGVYIKFIIWTRKKELWSGEWCSNPGLEASSQSASEWELSDRSYLGLGYSTFVWSEGEREGPLVKNVFSNPQPSATITENGDMVAAWTYDDPKKDLLGALEITYSTYDHQERAWSEPRMITSDNLLDLNPKLAYLENGRVVAVWQRITRELENEASPLEYVGDVELAYSIFDPETGEWSEPQPITSNNTYEAGSTLASYSGKSLLVYISDSDNNPFTSYDQAIVATEWTGEGWSEPETIVSGISIVGAPCLSLGGVNEGVLLFVRDMDDNILTAADREVFYLIYDGSWGAPTRLTTNDIEEGVPSAGLANDRWYLSWIEMEPTENTIEYTTSVRFAELVNGRLVERGVLFENQGVTDQFLLGEIHDELYLLGQVGARGTPMLMRYNGDEWENVENFLWSPIIENACTSQLSVSVEGNHLGTVGATEVQTGGGETSTSLHASTLSLYTVTTSVEPLGGGSVTLSPSEGPYAAGAKVTITAVLASGYELDYWSGDVSETSTSVTLTMDSDKNVTAHFRSISEGEEGPPLIHLVLGITVFVIIAIVVVIVTRHR